MIPNTDWFPWENVTEEDRGHGTVCWVWGGPLPPTATTINVLKKVKRLFREFVPERPKGHLWMHLCERYGEMNRCVRPDHIVVGTKSANAAHWNALRRAAGVPLPGVEKRTGIVRSDETKERMTDALNIRVEREAAAGPYSCPDCGREFRFPGGRTRHCRQTHGAER